VLGVASFAIVVAAESRATWPSYLAFALLVVGLVAVIWHNQRARRRARDSSLGGSGGSTGDPPD
jgi:hypothetical protein